MTKSEKNLNRYSIKSYDYKIHHLIFNAHQITEVDIFCTLILSNVVK